MRRCLSCSRQIDSTLQACPHCQASASAINPNNGRFSSPGTASPIPTGSCCSICDRAIPPKFEGEHLYGVLVCSGCRSEFASQRIFAQLIDLFAWGFFLMFLAGIFRSFGSPGKVTIVCSLIALPGYLLKDYLNGGSVGKQITGLRVIDAESGAPLSAKASLLRNLPLVIPGVPLAVAFSLLDGFRFGDKYANSKVISVSRANKSPFLVYGNSSADNSFAYSERLGRI